MNPIGYWVRRIHEIDQEIAYIDTCFEDLRTRFARAEEERAQEPDKFLKWSRVFGALEKEDKRLHARLNACNVEKSEKFRKLEARIPALSEREQIMVRLALQVQNMSPEEVARLSSDQKGLMTEWEAFVQTTPPGHSAEEEAALTEDTPLPAQAAPATPPSQRVEAPQPPVKALTPQELQALVAKLSPQNLPNLTLAEIETLLDLHARLSHRAQSPADIQARQFLNSRLGAVAEQCRHLAAMWDENG